MSEKVVVYERSDGGVSVVSFPEGVVPVMVDASSLPASRELRGSWRIVDGQVVEE